MNNFVEHVARRSTATGYCIPKELVSGKKYEVMTKRKIFGLEQYSLRGLRQEFDSYWFRDEMEEDETYVGYVLADKISVGENIEVIVFTSERGKLKLENKTARYIQAVTEYGDGIVHIRSVREKFYLKRYCNSPILRNPDIEKNYMAGYSCNLPKIGENFECFILETYSKEAGIPRLVEFESEPVKDIKYLGNNISLVITDKTEYFVLINDVY